MKQDRSLLLAMTIPPLLEFGIVLASFQIPGLLATTSDLPAPTVLGIIWSAMFVVVFGVVPLLSAIYVWDKGIKIVSAFAVAEALFYFFFGAHPSPLLGLPTLAWLHIPIAVVVGSAIILKRAFARKDVVTELPVHPYVLGELVHLVLSQPCLQVGVRLAQPYRQRCNLALLPRLLQALSGGPAGRPS